MTGSIPAVIFQLELDDLSSLSFRQSLFEGLGWQVENVGF
jgi:hypothetical protein